MIYDEGFEVAMGDMVYFAFSKFTFTDGPEGQNNVSHCDKTQVGWYHDTVRSQWGCYMGRKVDATPDDTTAPAPPPPAQASDSVTQDSSPALALDAFGSAVDTTSQATALVEDDSSNKVQDSTQSSSSTDSKAQDSSQSNTDEDLANAEAAQDANTQSSDGQRTASDSTAESSGGQDDATAQTSGENQAATQDASTQSSDAQQAAQGASTSDASSSTQSASDQQEKAIEDLYKEPAEYQPWVPKSEGYDKPMKVNWQQSVADALNFLQLGWTASAYDQFMGKTPRQLNRLAGVRRNRPHPHLKAVSPAVAQTPFTSFLGMASKHKRIHRSKSKDADTFDWRNKDGKNFLTPVVTQGDCGSCYTISTVHMLTARNRIRADSTSEPSFSVSFPLYCSEYNQGCDGGYGFLQSKWNEDVGLVPESCLPFSQGGGSCAIAKHCDLGNKRYRAHNHHYVGGYYGGSDADAIRRELAEKGPLVMSFEPKEDFMYYKTGVYRSGPNKIHQEWEQVDHAVLLIGFGVDKKQAYWTLQNSWGTDWGEAGFFRMDRGNDESGCESIAVAADVVEEESNHVLDDFIAELA
jgi:cathepsin C